MTSIRYVARTTLRDSLRRTRLQCPHPNLEYMNQRNPRSITRLRILAEAHTMLLSDGMPEPIGVRLADVLARLGLTTGAAYNIWESQNHFREDLMLHLTTHQAPSPVHDEPSVATIIDQDGLDEVAAVCALLIHCVRRVEAAPDHAVTYYLATIGNPSSELASAIESAQEHSLAHARAVVHAWMDHFEKRPKPPHSAETLAATARSATEGIVLRRRFEPDDAVLDVDARWVRAIAEGLVALSEPR